MFVGHFMFVSLSTLQRPPWATLGPRGTGPPPFRQEISCNWSAQGCWAQYNPLPSRKQELELAPPPTRAPKEASVRDFRTPWRSSREPLLDFSFCKNHRFSTFWALLGWSVSVLDSLWAVVFHTIFLQILVVSLLLKVDFFNNFLRNLVGSLLQNGSMRVDFFNTA